jgi:hypothetical protein
MYSTPVYLYQQKQQVLLPATDDGPYFQRRWQPVYAKKLKVNRGVDNVILFEFINQDQKPVNISGSTITYRMMSTDGDELLIAKDLEILNALHGRAKVTLTTAELDIIEEQTATWSLERASGNLYETVFTDAYSAGRGQVDIVDSVYPDFVESTILELPEPTIKRSAANGDRNYTSMAYTANNTLTTFQLDFDNFTGNVIAQGSETQIGPDWYDIGLQTVYANQNTRSYINIDGRHNWIRFQLNQYGLSGEGVATVANGAVTAITSAGGSEWFGAGNPNVDIEGNPGGTGATATATLNSNSVGSITVTNGGQGYIEVPLVKINNGRITQILYR